MRAIKFRGKRVDNGEWVYGHYVKMNDHYSYITGKMLEAYEDYSILEDWDLVDPATVGQFTGLLDKNGEEIYEGDLIEFKSERFTNFGNTPTGKFSVHVDVIEWMGVECKGSGRGCWGVRLVDADDFNKHKIGSPISSAIHVPIHLYGEVIGNIHTEDGE